MVDPEQCCWPATIPGELNARDSTNQWFLICDIRPKPWVKPRIPNWILLQNLYFHGETISRCQWSYFCEPLRGRWCPPVPRDWTGHEKRDGWLQSCRRTLAYSETIRVHRLLVRLGGQLDRCVCRKRTERPAGLPRTPLQRADCLPTTCGRGAGGLYPIWATVTAPAEPWHTRDSRGDL